MTLKRGKLEISADVDGDGTVEDGVFEMVAGENLAISQGMDPGYLVGERGSTQLAVLSDLLGSGESNRKSFFLELGGGARTWEVSFEGWKGATDGDGNNIQWGNDSASTKTKASATGQDPITQIDVLMEYLTVAEIDSRNPATWSFGENSADGLYRPRDVVVFTSNMTRAASDGPWFTGSMLLIHAADLQDVYDAQQTTP